MILSLLALFLPLLAFTNEANWRNALLYSIVIGFLQDPLRKIAPNQPAFYVGLVLVGITLSALLIYSRVGRLNLAMLFSGDRRLSSMVEVFLGLLLLQSVNSFMNFGSPALTLVGLGFYLAPLITLWLGFQFALQPSAVQKFLRLYLVMALLFAFTLLLSYRGYQSPLFKEVGQGLQIHISELGEYVQGYVGFWRSSEVAAWHLGTACCFVLILGVSSRRPALITLASVLMISLLVMSTLTGRRKVLTLVAGFLAFFLLLISWRGDPRVRSSLLAGAGGGVVLLLLLISLGGDPTSEGMLGVYIRRGGTVWEDIGERFDTLGFNAIGLAIKSAGPFGFGVGAAAQGARSLGLQTANTFGSSEGGLGRVTAELGLAGIALFAVVLALLAFLYWRIIRQLRYAPPSYGLMNLGLMAFVAANVPNFAAASQVYGDPFVLSILGLSAGFVLACPAVIQAHLRSQRLAAGLADDALPNRPILAPSRVSRP
jgi:hypothetical protein